jgi:hypothetical protein
MASPPAQVELFFSEHLVQQHTGTFATVYNGAGQPVSGDGRIDPQDGKHLIVPLHGTLDAGTYVVCWKTTSDDDGGVTLGNFAFAVGPTPAQTAQQTGVSGQVLVPDDERGRALSFAVKSGSDSAAGLTGLAAGTAAGFTVGSLLAYVLMRRRLRRPRGTRTPPPHSHRR